MPLLVILNQVSFVDISKEKNEMTITNINGVEKLIMFSSKDEIMRCSKFIREIITGTDYHHYNLFVEGDPLANIKVDPFKRAKQKSKPTPSKMAFDGLGKEF